MIKNVEAAHRQDNSEGTEYIPDKIIKAGQAWAGDVNLICRLPGSRVSKKRVG